MSLFYKNYRELKTACGHMMPPHTLMSFAHVNHLLTIGNQRLFLLSQLKNQGLALDSLHIVYQAIIQSKIIYALPAFAGQLTAMNITRFDALARKAKRRGLAKTIPSMLEIRGPR